MHTKWREGDRWRPFCSLYEVPDGRSGIQTVNFQSRRNSINSISPSKSARLQLEAGFNCPTNSSGQMDCTSRAEKAEQIAPWQVLSSQSTDCWRCKRSRCGSFPLGCPCCNTRGWEGSRLRQASASQPRDVQNRSAGRSWFLLEKRPCQQGLYRPV